MYEKRKSEQLEMEKIKGVTYEILKVYGIAPGKKLGCVTRVIYEHKNVFNSWTTWNENLEKSKDIIDDLEADVVPYSKLRLNWKQKDIRNGFS